MKLKLLVLAAVTVILTITSINLYISKGKLESLLQRAGEDIEATDDYWASMMGDYQVDVSQDSIHIRDNENNIGAFLLDYDADPLSTLILEDNR